MVEVSSLIALLRGDDDAAPVLHPKLVVLILDGLADPGSGGRWMGNVFALCDVLFGTDQVAPKTAVRYADEVGLEAWNVLVAGLSAWKQQSQAAA